MFAHHVLLTCLVVVVAACSATISIPGPAPEPEGPNTAANLDIPPGHLPPPGQCRIWISEQPPGQQGPPRSCDGIEAAAPAGAWILYRPTSDRRVVHVRYVDSARVGVVIRIRVFEVDTGKFVREEKPERERGRA